MGSRPLAFYLQHIAILIALALVDAILIFGGTQ